MAIEVSGVCPYFEVYDMPTSVRFYRDKLGFEIVSTSPHLGGDKDRFHWCWLRLGGAKIGTVGGGFSAASSPPIQPPPFRIPPCG